MKKIFLIPTLVLLLIFSGCDFTKKTVRNINLFTIEDDITLGLQVSQEIAADPTQFPILKEQGNEEVYRYVRGITTKILNSGAVTNRDKFTWEVKIINDDKTLNAFATPGGHIYVYTALIKYLDNEDQLAGVMGHEIAHADRRHSTNQMTKSLGLQLLLDATLGQKDALKQVVGGLLSLKFSRSHETEADEYSVKYLCNTDYNAAGAAGFFKKIGSAGSPPEFLSTHPSPANRVEDIEKLSATMGCRGTKLYQEEYTRIKNKLR